MGNEIPKVRRVRRVREQKEREFESGGGKEKKKENFLFFIYKFIHLISFKSYMLFF